MTRLKNPALEGVEGRVARIAEILDESKTEAIVALDLRGISDVADFFLIATARSATQMKAVARKLQDTLRAEGLRPFVPVEDESPRWTIMDYGSIVVHLFDPEAREHYQLEQVWGDATEVPWKGVLSA